MHTTKMQTILSEVELIRPLELSEEMYASYGNFIGYSVRAVGALDVRVLEKAFELLRTSYPILAARIVDIGSGRRGLTVGGVSNGAQASEHRGVSVVDGDPSRTLDGFAASQSIQVSAVHVVRDAAVASVTLLTHHGVADGKHSLKLLAELWAIYTAVANGTEVAFEQHPYPAPMEQLLADRGFTADDEVATAPKESLHAGVTSAAATGEPEPSPGGGAAPDAAGSFAQEFIRVQLSSDQVASLIGFGHREKVSLNGLISAALILAESKVRSLPITNISYMYAMDLRSRVEPPVGLVEATNMVSLGFYQATPQTPAQVSGLGREINAQMAAAIAAGETLRMVLAPDSFLASLAAIAAQASVSDIGHAHLASSNWGVVQDLPSPDGLALEEFHPAVYLESRSPQGVSVVSVDGLVGDVFITTYKGRLSLDFPAAHGDREEAQAHADATREILLELL